MNIIKMKRNKILKGFKQIEKTDLTSAHMVAGKIIFEKCFKSKMHKRNYVDKFLLERGDYETQNQEILMQKINEIKTPLTRKKVNSLVQDMVLSKKASIEIETLKKATKNEEYKRQIKGNCLYCLL